MKLKSAILAVVLLMGFATATLGQEASKKTVDVSDEGLTLNNDGSSIHIGGKLTDHWTDILVPFGAFAMVVGIIWIRHRSNTKEVEARLAAIKVLAEKGQPVPPEMLPGSGTAFVTGDMNRTVVHKAIRNIAFGIGLAIFFLIKNPHGGVWAFGLALMLMGVGSLWVAKNSTKQN
jgi:hypothetical protein